MSLSFRHSTYSKFRVLDAPEEFSEGFSVLAAELAATVLRFSASRANKSRLELSVGGGERGVGVVVVVVGGAVGRVMGREKEGLEDLDGGFGSSLIMHQRRKEM